VTDVVGRRGTCQGRQCTGRQRMEMGSVEDGCREGIERGAEEGGCGLWS
jgi:hypothetical protein